MTSELSNQHDTSASGGTERPRWLIVAAWLLQAAAAVVFLMAGGSKLLGVDRMVTLFQEIGIGQWFRYLTGIIEVAGGLLITVPATATIGAVLLACVMIGAIYTHVAVIGGSPVPAAILLVITVAVAWLRRPARY